MEEAGEKAGSSIIKASKLQQSISQHQQNQCQSKISPKNWREHIFKIHQMNRLSYVEFKNCWIYPKLVSSYSYSAHLNLNLSRNNGWRLSWLGGSVESLISTYSFALYHCIWTNSICTFVLTLMWLVCLRISSCKAHSQYAVIVNYKLTESSPTSNKNQHILFLKSAR